MPKWMRSKELFEDQQFLEDVFKADVPSAQLQKCDFSQVRVGDIFFFSSRLYKEQFADPKYFHMAVCIENSPGVGPVFVHARLYKKLDAVTVWPLEKFVRSKRYTLLRGVRRVKRRIGVVSSREEQAFYAVID